MKQARKGGEESRHLMKMARPTKRLLIKAFVSDSYCLVSPWDRVLLSVEYSISQLTGHICLSVLETQYSGDSILLIFPDSTGPALLSALIAGIPLNRVHELDFKPGEIRLDVTMDSTMAFLKSNVNREEYNAAIANGRKELKRLREMKPDDVISVKDQKLEKDRLEMEATARRREEKRLAKEQAGRLAREAQDRQLKEARQRNHDKNGDESQEVATAVILGAAGVGVVGAAIALTGNNNDEKETTTPSDKAFPELPTNGTEMETQDISMDVNILNRPLIATSGDDDEQTMISTRVNGDRRASFPPSNAATDPVKKAKQAMKEYMESDDGGNAWLQVMSDLMMEDDEPEDKADDPDSR